jgi:hypothetical protein
VSVRNHYWMPFTMVHRRSAAVDASLRCFVSWAMNVYNMFNKRRKKCGEQHRSFDGSNLVHSAVEHSLAVLSFVLYSLQLGTVEYHPSSLFLCYCSTPQTIERWHENDFRSHVRAHTTSVLQVQRFVFRFGCDEGSKPMSLRPEPPLHYITLR